MTSDMIGWAAVIIHVLAAIYVAHKNVIGLWLMLAGNVLWAVVGYITNLPSLVAVSVIMGMLDLYGVYYWNRKPSTRYDDLMAPPMNGHRTRNRYNPRGLRIWPPRT